jgi:ornithine--oxo-acid transaminase
MNLTLKKEGEYAARNYLPLPVVLVRGKGVHLWDDAGNRYVDMMSAYSAVSCGHGHPRLLAALRRQSEELAIVSRAFHTDKLAPFLEKLCRLSGMDMALPMNTGAEAAETAIKAARLWGYKVKGIPEGRAEIIVADGNFHGRTTTLVGCSSEPAYRDGFGPFAPGFVCVPFGDAAALERAITPDACAFLVEPMQGEAGIRIPPAGWLAEVQKICKKHNVLLVLDEIQTGLGRTGKRFAFEHEIDKPDGLLLGKALGGGLLPVSAFLAKREVMELFTPGSHGSTFGGNPLSAAVGLEALGVLEEEGLTENSRALGLYMLERLRAVPCDFVRDVRGKGLWIGVDIDPKRASARELCERLMEKGVLSKETHGTVIRFAPPLTVTQDVLDFVLDAFERTLKEAA